MDSIKAIVDGGAFVTAPSQHANEFLYIQYRLSSQYSTRTLIVSVPLSVYDRRNLLRVTLRVMLLNLDILKRYMSDNI